MAWHGKIKDFAGQISVGWAMMSWSGMSLSGGDSSESDVLSVTFQFILTKHGDIVRMK